MFVIKLVPNRFKILSAESEYAQYIGVSNMDGVAFPTNAYPKLFTDKESAEKFMKTLYSLYADGATIEEYVE